MDFAALESLQRVEFLPLVAVAVAVADYNE